MSDQPDRPDSSADPTQWLARYFQAGQQMMQPFIAAAAAPPADAPPADAPPPAAANPYAQLVAASMGFAEMQQNYLRQMSNLWLGMATAVTQATGAAPPEGDKRFAGEAWRRDPAFEALARAYLAYSDLMKSSVEAAPVEDKVKGQLRFAVRQLIDAMSPANYLATNPEAMELAIATGGQSLVDGMALLFKDLAKGRVSMTDEEAFVVGRDIATTEGAVIFENELIEVIQYTPRTPRVFQRPLVIIPPCINKYYILDLTPENSFVRYALDRGHAVFMLSWRNITADVGHLTWDDYLRLGVMQAIDVAQDVTGAHDVNALGFCVGGTLLASAVAVMKANAEDKVASVTLLTTLLDFSDPGEIGVLVTPESVDAREEAIGKGGIMEGKELALTFSSLRANDLIWSYVVNSYLKGKSPPAFDLLYWNADGTNLPGPMFCWYVRNCYLENNLRVPGSTIQCGVPVDLSEIDVPAFVYASRDDHIVPWRTAYASTQLLGGESTFLLGASGHIAGVVNPPAKNKRNYWVGGAGADPEQWLASARSVPGSWWPVWGEWLAQQAGAEVAAPAKPGNRTYRRLRPAPGRYVIAKAEP
jgi:polyhydroxyalkanoate synthase subunit PhaC